MQSSIAHNLKLYLQYALKTLTTISYNIFKLLLNNWRCTSISFPSCLGPKIIIDNIIYFFFMHNQGGEL